MQSDRCAAKELCKAGDLPLPLTGRHICAICKGATHSAGLGCAHELDEVIHLLNKKRVEENHPHFPSSNTICLRCYVSYSNAAVAGANLTDIMDDDDDDDDDHNSRVGSNSVEEQYSDDGSGGGKISAVVNVAVNGDHKRAAIAPKTMKSKGERNGDHERAAIAPKTMKSKGKRQNFSLKRKLELLEEVESKRSSQQEVLKREGIARTSFNRWRKNKDNIMRQVEDDYRGKLKRQLHVDGLKRVKDGIHKFYDLNDTMPKSLRIPLTREFLCF